MPIKKSAKKAAKPKGPTVKELEAKIKELEESLEWWKREGKSQRPT